jgi:hypothetical protein
MQDVNHEGETSGAWVDLKARLRRLLDGARAVNAAIDEGIASTAERQHQFERDVLTEADRLKAEREAARGLNHTP